MGVVAARRSDRARGRRASGRASARPGSDGITQRRRLAVALVLVALASAARAEEPAADVAAALPRSTGST